jgi:hypothetical protein
MDLGVLATFALGAVFVGVLLFGFYAAIRRMQGRPTRFDRFFELLARSQGAGVYPPSLRGNPDPIEQEVSEVSRGDKATRETPGEARKKPSGPRR